MFGFDARQSRYEESDPTDTATREQRDAAPLFALFAERSGATPASGWSRLSARSVLLLRRGLHRRPAPPQDEFALTVSLSRDILSANKAYSRETAIPHSFRAERSGANPANRHRRHSGARIDSKGSDSLSERLFA